MNHESRRNKTTYLTVNRVVTLSISFASTMIESRPLLRYHRFVGNLVKPCETFLPSVSFISQPCYCQSLVRRYSTRQPENDLFGSLQTQEQ